MTFVCRVLKESQHSRVFTPRNPWINTLMAILREVYDITLHSDLTHNRQPNSDHLMEIDSLFKALNVQGPGEIKPHGILRTLQSPNAVPDQVVRRELDFMHKKVKVILPSQPAPPPSPPGPGESKEQPRPQASLQELSSQVSNQLVGAGGVGGTMPPSSSGYSESAMLREQMS